MPTNRPLVRFAPLMLLAGAIGCDQPAPPPAAVRPSAAAAHAPAEHADHADHGHAGHDHDHEEPTSFADGVAKLKSLGEDLADKLATNAGEAADDAVHGIGHLLEAVREHATKAGLPDAATKALDELEECFGKVDEAFHSAEASADPKKVLESVKERIETAFKALEEMK
ncbi:MAG: hypothetical protein KGR24_04090 [Planctomycetes bacterium]|nr:hypothetical protein [Planctomycetota bacterium]